MKPLSDRIEELAVQAGYDGLPDDKADLLSAAAILRSVESAPVGKAGYYCRPTMGAATGVMFEGPDFTPLIGQRVSLVPLPQQSET